MTLRRVFTGLMLVFIFVSCSVNSRITKADKKFALGEYYKAAEMYRSVYPSVPVKNRRQKAEVAFKMGNAYRIIDNNSKAETAYRNALRYGCKDTLVYYYYGEVLRRNGKYTEALKQYEVFSNLNPGDPRSVNGIESCRRSLAEWKSAGRYQVSKVPSLNSKYAEFCPALASSDGDVIYFNSTRVARGVKSRASKITGQRNNDIYFSRTNVQGKWEEPELVEGEINSDFDEGTVAFSSDRQTMYFMVSRIEKGKTLGTQIYMSVRSGGEWGSPVKVELLKDSTLNVAHPAPSPDGEWLYFVSDMPGGYGGKDIWRVPRKDGGWGPAENLGPSVNTKGDEMFPSFRDDGTLYFSSDGHPGLGGLDIFSATPEVKSNVTDRDTWKVTNLLQPINSKGDDFGITFVDKKDRGFFSSNRGDRKYRDHIFMFETPEYEYTITGTVVDTKGAELGDAVIKVVGDDGTIANVKVRKNGSFSYSVNPGCRYLMLATCRGFLNSKEIVEVPMVDRSEQFKKDFVLTSISNPVKMNNIFFKFGSAELSPESSAGLDDLVKLLNDNPNITIEIGAHTDMIGTVDANRKLSQARAGSVVSYLVSKGIEADRLSAVGYGESEPVVPDRDLVKKYKFLKVDVPLDEMFITKLPHDQQEIANQINRRTEFKVVKTTYKMF